MAPGNGREAGSGAVPAYGAYIQPPRDLEPSLRSTTG